MLRALLAVLLLALSSSCQKPKAVASCDLSATYCSCDLRSTSDASCKDYTGKTVAAATSECATAGGTLSSSALCSTTGRVGTCKISVLGAVTYSRYYSDVVTNAAACTLANMGTGFLGTVEWVAEREKGPIDFQ